MWKILYATISEQSVYWPEEAIRDPANDKGVVPTLHLWTPVYPIFHSSERTRELCVSLTYVSAMYITAQPVHFYYSFDIWSSMLPIRPVLYSISYDWKILY